MTNLVPGPNTITKAQLLTLLASTSGAAVASGLGPISIRWQRNSGNTGPTDGVDVSFNVVSPSMTIRRDLYDLSFYGSSSTAGNQDLSGVTTATLAATIPGTKTVTNAGVGGATTSLSTGVRKQMSDATSDRKAGTSIIQYDTNDWTPSSAIGIDITKLGEFITSATTFLDSTAISNKRFAVWTGTEYGYGNVTNTRNRRFQRMLWNQYPGQVINMMEYWERAARDGAFVGTGTYAGATDLTTQANGQIPISYQIADRSHLLAKGYQYFHTAWQKDYIESVEAGGCPFFAIFPYYTTAATAQTNGGDVVQLNYTGTLTGTTLSVEALAGGAHPHFTVSNTAMLKRASSDVLTDQLNEFILVVTRNGNTKRYYQKVSIGSLTTAPQRMLTDGHMWGNVETNDYGGTLAEPTFNLATARTWSSAVGAGPFYELSIVLDYEATADDDDHYLFYQATGLHIRRVAGGTMRILFNGIDGASAGSISLSGATVVNGRQLWFYHAKVDSSAYQELIADIGATTVRATATTPTPSKPNINLNPLVSTAPATAHTFIFANATPGQSGTGAALPTTTNVTKAKIGFVWMAAKAIDFSVEANRLLFRSDRNTMVDLGVAVSGKAPGDGRSVIVQAGGKGLNVGQTVTPFFYHRGGAADFGKNFGTGGDFEVWNRRDPTGVVANQGVASTLPNFKVGTPDELISAVSALSVSGGVIELASSGVFSDMTFNQRPVRTLKLIGESSSTRAKMKNVQLEGTTNFWFENIDFGDSTSTSGNCLYGKGASLPTYDVSENTTLVNCDFYGQAYDPYGDFVSAVPTSRNGIGGDFRTLNVRKCFFFALSSCLKPNRATGALTYHWNLFDLHHSDCIYVGVTDAITSVSIENNFETRATGKSTDLPTPEKPGGDGPHCDFIQLTCNTSTNVDLFRATIRGNVKFIGESRAGGQAVIVSSNLAYNSKYREFICTDNIFVSDNPTGLGINTGEQKGPSIRYASGSNISRNINLRSNPGNGTGGSLVVTNWVPDSIPNLMADNVCEGFSGTGVERINNYTVANNSTAHTAAFEGPFPILGGASYGTRANLLALRASIVAAAKPKGPLAALRDVYNFTTGTLNSALTRPYAPLENAFDVPVLTAFETDWVPVLNGGKGIAISVPAGTSYRIADSRFGDGATDYSTAESTINEGQYLKLKRTSHASTNTSVSYGVTLGAYTYSKNITTVGATQFSSVSNQGTAWSLISATPASDASRKRMVLSFEAKANVTDNFKALFGMGTGGTNQFSSVTTSKQSLRLVSSGTVAVTNDNNIDTNWHRHIILLDLAATEPEEILRWYRNGVLQTWSGDVVTTGSASFNPATIFNAFCLFAKGNTTGTPSELGNGTFRYYWADWGDATYTFPADSDPHALNNSFAADNINMTTGAGPIGYQPKIFLTGTASEWNAGLTNKGSLSFVMNKQSGTYI